MTTKFIGIKEFRQDMAGIAALARKRNERLIILRKNKPVFELRPLDSDEALLESFGRTIGEARADAKAGRVHSQTKVEKLLGL